MSAAPSPWEDVEVIDYGSIVLFRPLTNACQAWIAENVENDALWFGGALVVEHRYAAHLVEDMADWGLIVA